MGHQPLGQSWAALDRHKQHRGKGAASTDAAQLPFPAPLLESRYLAARAPQSAAADPRPSCPAALRDKPSMRLASMFLSPYIQPSRSSV